MKRTLVLTLSLAVLIAGCSRSERTGGSLRSAGHLVAPRSTAVETGSISGVVTDAAHGGAPVAGVLVTAFSFTNNNGFLLFTHVGVGFAVTDANGAYTITGLPDATYMVCARPSLTSPDDSHNLVNPLEPIHPRFTTLVPQWQDGSDLTQANGRTAALTDPIAVSGGGAASGVNFPLRTDTRVSAGTAMLEFAHAPAVGMHILATTSFGEGLPVSVAAAAAVTDANGHFTIAGLPNSSDVYEEDIEAREPAFPEMSTSSVHSASFTGATPRTDVQILIRPFDHDPAVFQGPNGPIVLGAAVDDPLDATNGAADVTHLEVRQLCDDANPHLTGCVGFHVHVPVRYRVDIVTSQPLASNVIYRLKVLLTDDLSLTGYTTRVIQTTGIQEDASGSFYLGLGPGDEAPSYSGENFRQLTNQDPLANLGFKTLGPALATDADPSGDLAAPGVSKLSWIFDLGSLGTLSGGGTGFYVYVETIGTKGAGGKQDVVPNKTTQSKAAQPLFIQRVDDFGEVVCGKSGVI